MTLCFHKASFSFLSALFRVSESTSEKEPVSTVKTGCGWGRNRTADTRIFSPLLCQLSYPAVASTLRQEVHYASFPKSGKRLLFRCGTGTTVVESGGTNIYCRSLI